MKTHRAIITMAACAALALPALNSSAQEFVEYTTGAHSVTIALTLKTTVPGTFEIDPETGAKAIDPETGKPIPAYESSFSNYDKNGNITKDTFTYVAKVLSQKYGNAELLRELAANGLLDPNSTSPSGWTLLATNASADPTATVYNLIARKKGFDDVALEINLSALDKVPSYTSTDINTYSYNADGDPTSTATGSGSYSSEGLVDISFNLSGEQGAPSDTLTGIFSETGSEFRWYADPADKSVQQKLYISKGAKITGLAGEITGGETFYFAVGTASIGAGKAVKVVQPAY